VTAIVAIASFMLGAILAASFLGREIRRQASFLGRRDPRGAEQATAHIPFGSPLRLARAINCFIEGAKCESENARKRNDELMRNLSDLSHDIRTPLAAAKGHLQLFDEAKNRDDAKSGEHLRAAMIRIDATASILDQLLELTRASDPDQEFRREPVPLLSVLVDALSNHERDFERLGWEPLVSFSQEGILVEADRRALERIIENLVTNAIRYGRPPFTCIQSAFGDEVVLKVSNGVDESDALDVTMLFDRFYRTGNARTGGGVGLGLPIAKALSDRMGMRLSAELDGSVISFKLVMSQVK
jgi:signal transduction histidine kinase